MQQAVPIGDLNPNGHVETTIVAALRGRSGSRRWSFRYELLDDTNTRVDDLDNVIDASIDHNWLADIKRTATFTLRDDGTINYLSDRIKPYARLHLPPYGVDDWVEWPLGVFLLSSPARRVDGTGLVFREVEAYDLLQVLADDLVDDRYSISSLSSSTEDFEDASLLWSWSGTWTRQSGTAYAGTWAYKSPATGHSASSSATLTLPTGAVEVQVRVKVSSENGYDFLEIHRGAVGAPYWEGSGEIGWELVTIPVEGYPSVTFRYIKDAADVSGGDAAWIDNVTVFVAGALYTDVITDILDESGLSVNITASTSTIPVDKEWEPGTSKLRIVNDLLSEINYESLAIDEAGVAVAQPYRSPTERAEEWVYADDEDSLTLPDVEQTIDLFSVANRWVLVVSEPDRDPIVGTYTNDDPASPTSTVNRARIITDFRTEQTAADQATLDEKAARLAFEASQIFEAIDFETGFNPLHSGNDVYRITHSPLAVDSKYAEHTWSCHLVAGAPMKHRARRVVSV